jgi:hypothetical protein
MDRKLIGTAIISAILGLFVGGLLWGSPPKTVTNTIELDRTVTVGRVVTVDVVRTVFVTQVLTASSATVTETHAADGTVTILSQYYGLGVTTESQTNETYHLSESISASVSESVKQSTTTEQYLNAVDISAFVDPFNPLTFDYKKDWIVGYNRFVGSSPFYGRIFIGPKMIGVGLGLAF